MQAKLIHEADGQRTFAVVLAPGDEVTRVIADVAAAHQLGASTLTAIGAFERAVLGYFDWETKDYWRIPVREQVEVLSLVGNVSREDGEPRFRQRLDDAEDAALPARVEHGLVGLHLDLSEAVQPTHVVEAVHGRRVPRRAGNVTAVQSPSAAWSVTRRRCGSSTVAPHAPQR